MSFARKALKTVGLVVMTSLAGPLEASKPSTEELLPEINFQISQYDPKLKKYFGKGNSERLCWPVSVAHRMMYLKNEKGLARLKVKKDPLANVLKFATICRTSKSRGTSQNRKVPCLNVSMRESGYSAKAFAIGPDSRTSKRAVAVGDLLKTLRENHGVILHVAWHRQDGKAWKEGGSHSVNAYGFKKENDRLYLAIVNPGINYSGRARGEMYDLVEAHETTDGIVLSGIGFDEPDVRPVVKNIYVF